MQVIADEKVPHARVWLTPQRASFGVCGPVPSEINFFNVADESFKFINPYGNNPSMERLPNELPCPGWLPATLKRPRTRRTCGQHVLASPLG